MSLKRRFSCFSRLAHVFQFFSFSLAPSRSSFPLPENLRSVLARAVAAPLNWIFPVSLTSYCTRCHSTYGCQRSRGFSPPTSHLTRQRQPCVRTFFFRYDGFLRPVRVDFFLIRTRARVHPSCIKVSFRSFGFFYHDNVPGYFPACISSPSSFPPCFIAASFLTHFCTRYQFAALHILVLFHMSSRVFPRVILFLSLPFFPTVPSLFFCALRCPRAASVRSIYRVFTFSRGSSPLHHVCSRVGYYFPIAPNFLLHI